MSYTNTHTNYSFKYGTLSPGELLAEARAKDLVTIALTDINSTAGSLSFVRLAPKYNIRPVLGIDFRNGADQCFVGIAKNNEGFKELNDYLSWYLHSKQPIPALAPSFKSCFVVYPYMKYRKTFLPEGTQELKDNEYLGLRPQDLSKLRFSPWKGRQEKLLAQQTVTFRNKRDFNAHRLLRAIDTNCLLSMLPKSEEGLPTDTMLTPKELESIYQEFPLLLENAEALLAACNITFEYGDKYPHKNQQCYTESQKEDDKLIEKLCTEGLAYRYEKPNKVVLDRIKKELEIIKQKNFTAYFLINWEIVSYARSKQYFYVGRGSGANSIVAYLLRITDVDPVELDLYFERFINLYRKNPPDFDVDFSWADREDITRYIFERFPHTTLLATYSTFQYRAVVRELGKVFGLPAAEIDALAHGRVQRVDEMGMLVLKYGKLIEGFPSHLSIHAGGILISEKSIHYFTATSLPPKGYPTTHFDMIIAEDIGLYKFDILSQRGLGKIKDTLAIVEKNRPNEPVIDIHDITRFKKDEKVKVLLREGMAIGCFYVESPAMRMLLKKLRVDHYLGLVAASSIIRPGVAKSGMMREYILRFRNPERQKQAHPVMLDIMPETFGVMVYQEDVIKVAHYFAGLTLAEADVLRRGMSGKFRSREEFQGAKEKFFSNCDAKGYAPELTAEIWRQTESFAGYAFSKGHSASYAVESYQSLFLKAHYPLEYMVAVLNNGGGFYRVELYIHEARMHGATIEAPCVNRSEGLTVIYGTAIYLGFSLVKELESKLYKILIINRLNMGNYIDLDDFVNRIDVSLDQLCLLIRVGAFRFIGTSKKELLWKAHFLLGKNPKSNMLARQAQSRLFDTRVREFELPELYTNSLEFAFDEMELLGFPLQSPFNLLLEKRFGFIRMIELKQHLGKVVTMQGYLITVKNTSASGNKRMHFGTFIDENGHFIDTVHFPPVAARYPFRGKGIYELKGKVVEEFDFYSLEVMSMKKEAIIEDPRYKLIG